MEFLHTIDWFIWEDPKTAYIFQNNCFVPMPDSFREIVLFDTDSTIINAPINRNSSDARDFVLTGKINVNDLLDNIYTFYNTDLTDEQVWLYYKIHKIMTHTKMMGDDFIDMYDDLKERRPKYSANGKVIFDGLEKISDNFYRLLVI